MNELNEILIVIAFFICAVIGLGVLWFLFARSSQHDMDNMPTMEKWRKKCHKK